MANLLTAIRLLLAIPVAWSFAVPAIFPPLWLALFLLVAIGSDYFDGIVARATNTASARGQLFDHGTDFVFVTAGLSGASIAGTVHPLLPLLIIIAFSQYVLDSYFLFKQKQLRMSFLGRWNGIFYFVPLVLIALSRLGVFTSFQGTFDSAIPTLVYALILTTVASIIDRAIAPLRGVNKGNG